MTATQQCNKCLLHLQLSSVLLGPGCAQHFPLWARASWPAVNQCPMLSVQIPTGLPWRHDSPEKALGAPPSITLCWTSCRLCLLATPLLQARRYWTQLAHIRMCRALRRQRAARGMSVTWKRCRLCGTGCCSCRWAVRWFIPRPAACKNFATAIRHDVCRPACRQLM